MPLEIDETRRVWGRHGECHSEDDWSTTESVSSQLEHCQGDQGASPSPGSRSVLSSATATDSTAKQQEENAQTPQDRTLTLQDQRDLVIPLEKEAVRRTWGLPN